MTWAPVQQRHAIEKIRFELAFTELLPSRVVDSAKRSFEQSRGELRFGDINPQEIHQITLQMAPTPIPAAQKAVGWISVRETSPGVVVESLSIHQNGFIYECADYREWAKAYRRFLSVSKKVVDLLATVIDFRSFSLDYTDRFVFQGPASQASPGAVIDPNLLVHMNGGVQSGAYQWHNHRGWFEHQADRLILMNQNIDAVDGKTHTGLDVRSLQIYTRAEFRPVPEQFKVEDLDDISANLHTMCNAAFSQVLTDAARQMVGL